MLLHADVLPPVVAGTAQLIPGISHQLVERIFHQAGEIRRCGELHLLGVVAAVQLQVAR